MTRSTLTRLIALAVSFLLIVQSAGCTVIGVGIGQSVDRRRPASKILAPNQAVHQAVGTRMTIYLRDSDRRVGIFAGLRAQRPAAGPSSSLVPPEWTAYGAKAGGTDPEILLVETPGEITAVAFTEIDSVRVPQNNRGAWWGGMVGASLDILIVLWFRYMFDPLEGLQ